MAMNVAEDSTNVSAGEKTAASPARWIPGLPKSSAPPGPTSPAPVPPASGAWSRPYNSTTRATMVIGNDSSMRMENDWLGAQRALVEPLLDLCVK